MRGWSVSRVSFFYCGVARDRLGLASVVKDSMMVTMSLYTQGVSYKEGQGRELLLAKTLL